jgi:hypothetical protein
MNWLLKLTSEIVISCLMLFKISISTNCTTIMSEAVSLLFYVYGWQESSSEVAKRLRDNVLD